VKCEGCGFDCTVTVVHVASILRVHPHSGRTSTETRARRLCVRCGGGDAPEALVAPTGHPPR
jgi:hypothetical protein